MACITSDLLVDEVLRRWPESIRVFLDHKFMCIGCPITCFHTVEDACREHQAPLPSFLAALNAVAENRETAEA